MSATTKSGFLPTPTTTPVPHLIGNEDVTKHFPACQLIEDRLRLGQMTRTWRKQGLNFVEAGEYILYYFEEAQLIVYLPEVLFSDGPHHTLIDCAKHWVEDREPGSIHRENHRAEARGENNG